MGDLEDPEEVLHGWDELGQVHGGAAERLVHGLEAVARDAVVVPDVLVELVPVARRLQEVQVRLADGHVLLRRRPLELLLPLLEETVLDAVVVAVALADVVRLHHVRDPARDLPGVAAAAREEREDLPGHLARRAVRGARGNVREALGELLLGLGHLGGLVGVAAGGEEGGIQGSRPGTAMRCARSDLFSDFTPDTPSLSALPCNPVGGRWARRLGWVRKLGRRG